MFFWMISCFLLLLLLLLLLLFAVDVDVCSFFCGEGIDAHARRWVWKCEWAYLRYLPDYELGNTLLALLSY